MDKIKFSHKYFKMPERFEFSEILQVVPIMREEISDTFYNYDTSYPTDFNEIKRYPLPNGKLLLIILKAKYGGVWTTIRRWSYEKEKYYRGLQGQQVKIVIEEMK